MTRRRHGFNTTLAEALSAPEGDTVPSRKGMPEKQRKRQRSAKQVHNTTAYLEMPKCLELPASGANKAGRVVGLPQDCDHLPLYKFPTIVAKCAMKPLEVQRTEVVSIPHEEATLSQVTATHCTNTQRCRCLNSDGSDNQSRDQTHNQIA